MNVKFYPASLTRILREVGVSVWQLRALEYRADVYTYDFRTNMPMRKAINQRITARLVDGRVALLPSDVKVIYRKPLVGGYMGLEYIRG